MNMKTLAILSVALFALTITACNEPRVWDPTEEHTTPEGKKTVLFAPIASGSLATDWPESRTVLASDMAVRIDTLVDDVEAWSGDELPGSEDPRWQQGMVLGEARGADMVFLTRVTDVVIDPRSDLRPMVEAKIRIEAINAQGQVFWFKEAVGRVANETSPKLMGPENEPVAQAVWAACSKALSAVTTMLDNLGGWLEPRDPTNLGPADPGVLVDVTINSTPANADILVDGIFRGTTPAVVPLSVKKMKLRIQRQGYQVWEMDVEPNSGMNINPALEPLVAE